MARGRGKLTPQDLNYMAVISQNIKKLLKEQGHKQIDLSRASGIPASTLTGYVKGTSLPIPENVTKMAHFFKVAEEDLDPRFAKDILDQDLKQLGDNYKHLAEEDRKKLLDYSAELLADLDKEKEQGFLAEEEAVYAVPTVTSLAAGLGYAFNDYDQETVYVPNQPPRFDLASFISGDSMEPVYRNGDIVYLVDKGLSTYSGQVCAVAHDNRTYLKKVYTEKNQLRLVSINPAYEDILIDFPPVDGHIRIYSVVGTDRVVANLY